VWHRYRGDGYGEHEDGRAYDGTGIGRGWPLLTGERGHYELCAGNDPLPYLEAMAAMASPGGMLPEQCGMPTRSPRAFCFPAAERLGDAARLAHAEFVKLLVSRQIGHPSAARARFWQRYQGHRAAAQHAFWWPHAPIGGFAAGARLAVALLHPSIVHWGRDGWLATMDMPTSDAGLGFHVAVLDTAALTPGSWVDFTWYRQDSGAWAGRDSPCAFSPPNRAGRSAPGIDPLNPDAM